MKKNTIALSEIKLVGITCQTSNINEADLLGRKIPDIINKYFSDPLFNQNINFEQSSELYSVYTNYESDYSGNYTYFFGRKVLSFDGIPEQFETLKIPTQNYIKFTTESGVMPNIVIEAWQKIWAMTSDDLGSERAYIADFEIYDERASDNQNAIVDIYIGIK